MQTILGAGGAIGVPLARALKAYTDSVRLVGRHPEKVNDDDQLFVADLAIASQVHEAIKGSGVAYLLVGLPYDIKAWRRLWPVIMRNVIDACKAHNTKLVFFDNIYIYDPDYLGRMTEETPLRPVSKKGKVREQLVRMIMDEVEAGNLTALIARAADFYGPGVQSSVLQETVLKNLLNGKKAQWFARLDKNHSFTYTPDAGKATALLGNTPDAYNQSWHLPASQEKLTGKEWIDLFARELGVEPRYQALPIWMLRLIGLFVPIMRELAEMAYQFDRDYFFDSSKFEKRFDFEITPYEEGVKEVVKVAREQA
ncbi:MAG: NAD-dependent epimerase/dehydratase family protein [Phaeodactylibacter sp.]|nr:NAD-dependent epimerase/dehydratase family protein [Phaeodactylibacter sp.]